MKEMLCIKGDRVLSGEVKIDGAKNALVALIPASILTKSIVKLENVKPIDDTYTLLKILDKLNVKVLYDNKGCLYIDARKVRNVKLDNKEMLEMRASYYFMGALLSLYDNVKALGPGGCNFGTRPIDLHLYAFECLGVNYTCEDKLYCFKKEKKEIKEIVFSKKSVGATINALLASCRIKGKIIIRNCSLEPEVDEVINFLNKCGGKIKRCDEDIVVEGVRKLHECEYKVMFDRIEAGTFMIIGGLVGNNLKISNVDVKCLGSVIKVLRDIGVKVVEGKNCLIVSKGDYYKSVRVLVEPYPGFPTDLQQPLTVLLSLCDGESVVKETIYPARLSHIDSLNMMGANIKLVDDEIIVEGKRSFVGKEVSGKDLRGGISLVLASLLAKEESKVDGVKYIKRGYSDLVYKLRKVGADISLKRDMGDEE